MIVSEGRLYLEVALKKENDAYNVVDVVAAAVGHGFPPEPLLWPHQPAGTNPGLGVETKRAWRGSIFRSCVEVPIFFNVLVSVTSLNVQIFNERKRLEVLFIA
jgi:hypothetical protein